MLWKSLYPLSSQEINTHVGAMTAYDSPIPAEAAVPRRPWNMAGPLVDDGSLRCAAPEKPPGMQRGRCERKYLQNTSCWRVFFSCFFEKTNVMYRITMCRIPQHVLCVCHRACCPYYRHHWAEPAPKLPEGKMARAWLKQTVGYLVSIFAWGCMMSSCWLIFVTFPYPGTLDSSMQKTW